MNISVESIRSEISYLIDLRRDDPDKFKQVSLQYDRALLHALQETQKFKELEGWPDKPDGYRYCAAP